MQKLSFCHFWKCKNREKQLVPDRVLPQFNILLFPYRKNDETSSSTTSSSFDLSERLRNRSTPDDVEMMASMTSTTAVCRFYRDGYCKKGHSPDSEFLNQVHSFLFKAVGTNCLFQNPMTFTHSHIEEQQWWDQQQIFEKVNELVNTKLLQSSFPFLFVSLKIYKVQ